MTFHLTLLTAIIALRRNRLRTALTMLSLMIGTASVITVFALGAGAYQAIEDDIATAGTNLIMVSGGNWTSAGVRGNGVFQLVSVSEQCARQACGRL